MRLLNTIDRKCASSVLVLAFFCVFLFLCVFVCVWLVVGGCLAFVEQRSLGALAKEERARRVSVTTSGAHTHKSNQQTHLQREDVERHERRAGLRRRVRRVGGRQHRLGHERADCVVWLFV